MFTFLIARKKTCKNCIVQGFVFKEFHAVLNKYGDWMGELGGKAMQLKLELAA
jgi:hypothetical protein